MYSKKKKTRTNRVVIYVYSFAVLQYNNNNFTIYWVRLSHGCNCIILCEPRYLVHLKCPTDMPISRDARNTKTPQNTYYTTDKIIMANLTAVLFGITRRTSVATPRVTVRSILSFDAVAVIIRIFPNDAIVRQTRQLRCRGRR